MLEIALDIFLEHGYEQTTTNEIAAAAGMSKRTLYARYSDKGELFREAVRRAVERYTIPREALEAVATDDLEETLTAIARLRISNVATPTGIRLQRILTTQSYRFTDLFSAAYEDGAGPTIEYLCDLFARYQSKGEVEVTDARRAALGFLSLVVGGPARLITSGSRISEEEIEAQVHFSVQLFLNGIRSRP